MSDNKNMTNILYAVLGVMVLVVSITGATFAYYTATESYNQEFGGDMAEITFNVMVDKKTSVDTENNRGLIPMTNSMIEDAVSNASTNGICLDDNSNAACQIYKITVNNTGTAGMFLDGYVTLSGGSGSSDDNETATTTMRWVQVFCTEKADGSLNTCSTSGKTTTRSETAGKNAPGVDSDWDALGTNEGHATEDIKLAADYDEVTTSALILTNPYNVISRNYIRVSLNPDGLYKQQDDVASALVYNQYLNPNNNSANDNSGDSDDTYTDSQIYYIAVWLTETGEDQSIGESGAHPTGTNFFSGVVTFNSAQGSEVTGTFKDYIAVTPDTKLPAGT